jgi:hypothetical protein
LKLPCCVVTGRVHALLTVSLPICIPFISLIVLHRRKRAAVWLCYPAEVHQALCACVVVPPPPQQLIFPPRAHCAFR